MPPYEWAPGALERLPEDIEPFEALQVVVEDRPRLPLPGTATGFPVLTVVGRTRTGRPLAVVCRDLGEMTWQVLFVRRLSDTEAAWFTTWEEGR
jgi:hypothetical protein